MANLSFDTKVLIEQVRCIETQLSPDAPPEPAINSGFRSREFDDRLVQRARFLVEQRQWGPALKHAAGTWRTSIVVACGVAALFGAGATIAAISGDSTINIYWLLIVLIGFNFLSLVLWITGFAFGMERLSRGVLTLGSSWLANLVGRRDSVTGAADKAWMNSNLGGRVGKWRYSLVNHGLWLVYLGTGLLALLLALTVRQYDFVWGTTLLSNSDFVQLTETLGLTLQTLGFATPDAQQVIETRIGSEFSPGADHRYRWAQFLMGALLVYGILPRVVLLLVCRGMLRAAQAGFALDYYLPYYMRLRQGLMPAHGDSIVVDADDTGRDLQDHGAVPVLTHAQVSRIPETTFWIGVELREGSDWPPSQVSSERVLGHIIDSVSQEEVMQRLQDNTAREIAIAVNAERAPDRGLQRLVKTLCENAELAWLVLLEKDGAITSDARLEDWYRLAMNCDIAADHIMQSPE